MSNFYFFYEYFFLYLYIDKLINSSLVLYSMGFYKVIVIEGGLNWFEILIELWLYDYFFICMFGGFFFGGICIIKRVRL